jgi:hypothetical protein
MEAGETKRRVFFDELIECTPPEVYHKFIQD